MMDLDDYKDATSSTAIYPNAGSGSALAMDYVLLGLVNEAGEVAGKAKKAYRDGQFAVTGVLAEGEREGLTDELGDVLWYFARLCAEKGVKFSNIIWDTTDEPAGLKDLALEVSFAACDLAAHDGKGDPRYARLLTAIGSMAEYLGTDVGTLASSNSEKLAGRAVRGTIKGSGDKR